MKIDYRPSKISHGIVFYDIISTFPEEKKLGFFELQFSEEKVLLVEIYIEEEFRDLGVGTIVLQRLIGFLREFGVEELWLLVAFMNEGAQKLYRRLGFQFENHISDYCYMMTLKLAKDTAEAVSQ